jgi:hypothetical protein
MTQKLSPVRDLYDCAVTTAVKDPLLNKSTGIRKKVYPLSKSYSYHPSHIYPSIQQLFRTVLAHLTTSIFDMSYYLNRNPTARDAPIKLSSFKPLTDKKLSHPARSKPSGSQQSSMPAVNQTVLAYFKEVGSSQEIFVADYARIYEAMSAARPISHSVRLAKDLPTRLFAMSGLYWAHDSKNRSRDWDKVGTAVVIEAALIQSYRVKMLKSCPTARDLRTELLEFFNSITPPWRQLPSLSGDKTWTFPDNIVIDEAEATNDIYHASKSTQPIIIEDDDDNPPDPPMTYRSEFQALMASKKSANKRRYKKKDDPPTPATAPVTDSEVVITDAHDDTPAASSTAKDTTATKKSDDLQSLLSALKSIQKHKLLQCSDPDAPAGSTESIVAFAASVIGHVHIDVYLSSTLIFTHVHSHSKGRISEQGTSRIQGQERRFKERKG